jgi:hypothetical protein
LLAFLAYAVFLRQYSLEPIPEADRRAAPLVALVVIAIVGLAFAAYWIAYRLGLQA